MRESFVWERRLREQLQREEWEISMEEQRIREAREGKRACVWSEREICTWVYFVIAKNGEG